MDKAFDLFGKVNTAPEQIEKDEDIKFNQILDNNFSIDVREIIMSKSYLKTAILEQEKLLDEYGFRHVSRCANKAAKLTKAFDLGFENASKLVQASILHDYGKTSQAIRHIFKSKKKYSDFSDEEKKQKEKHISERLEWLKDLGLDLDIIHLVLSHHEPDYRREGVKRRQNDLEYEGENKRNRERRSEISENLSKLSRIFSLIDKTDAMLNKRSYQDAKDPLLCENELKKLFNKNEYSAMIEFLIENND